MNQDSIIRISEAMRELGIESIRYTPADCHVTRDTYQVRLLDGWMPSDCGSADTVAEAYEQAVRIVRGRKAA